MSLNQEKIEQQVKDFLQSPLLEKGYELVAIDFVHSHVGKVLRVYLDTKGGISSDQCAKAHRLIEDLLSTEPIDDLKYQQMGIEVCSPGARKPAGSK